jgi:AcrR family transcriptional regulator
MKCATGFKRARQPEQIQQRRADILAAAADLMSQQGFDQVSLNGIARKAGVAKSNVYRYFESKEDIFLQLLKHDWGSWVQQLEQDTCPLSGSNDIDRLSSLMAQSIADCPRMCELISVLASVLEQNLSEQALYAFKSESIQLALKVVAAIQRVVPVLPPDTLLPIGHSLFALIAGLWPLGNPTALVTRVMARPELSAYQLDFQPTLQNALKLMLKGACQT